MTAQKRDGIGLGVLTGLASRQLGMHLSGMGRGAFLYGRART